MVEGWEAKLQGCTPHPTPAWGLLHPSRSLVVEPRAARCSVLVHAGTGRRDLRTQSRLLLHNSSAARPTPSSFSPTFQFWLATLHCSLLLFPDNRLASHQTRPFGRLSPFCDQIHRTSRRPTLGILTSILQHNLAQHLPLPPQACALSHTYLLSRDTRLLSLSLPAAITSHYS